MTDLILYFRMQSESSNFLPFFEPSPGARSFAQSTPACVANFCVLWDRIPLVTDCGFVLYVRCSRNTYPSSVRSLCSWLVLVHLLTEFLPHGLIYFSLTTFSSRVIVRPHFGCRTIACLCGCGCHRCLPPHMRLPWRPLAVPLRSAVRPAASDCNPRSCRGSRRHHEGDARPSAHCLN